MKKVMLTGVRPSGNLTIGNYLGAIKNFVDRQDKYNSYIFIADLHAITSYIEPSKLKSAIYDCIAMYLACGIDPNKTIIFKQSDVLEHGELGFIMTFQTKMGELNRMTQFKYKSQTSTKEGVDLVVSNTKTHLIFGDTNIEDSQYWSDAFGKREHIKVSNSLIVLSFSKRE